MSVDSAISVADPGCLSRIRFFHPGSRIKKIPVSGPASKNLSILTQKLFLSSRKYDSGCSSRIRIPDLEFLPNPDPGVKKEPDPGSGTLKILRRCFLADLTQVKAVYSVGDGAGQPRLAATHVRHCTAKQASQPFAFMN
jgi:hypothetical protein